MHYPDIELLNREQERDGVLEICQRGKTDVNVILLEKENLDEFILKLRGIFEDKDA